MNDLPSPSGRTARRSPLRRLGYWQRNLVVTAVLLCIWFIVTFVLAFYARELNEVVILGFPLGFYMGAQGSLLVYLAIVAFYAFFMNRMDREYEEGSNDEATK